MTDYRAQALAELTGPGGAFEVVHEDVLGTRLPVFKNRLRNLRELLERSAVLGDSTYFKLNDEVLTYAANLHAAAQLARALTDRGVGKGDRVAIFSANRPDYATLFWGAINVGAIVTAYNGWWTADEVRYATELTEPALLVGDHRRLVRIEGRDLGVPIIEFESGFATPRADDPLLLQGPPIDEDDPAVILFTSGTTGRAKGATVSHRGLVGFVQVTACTGAVRARTTALAGGASVAPTSEQNVTLLTSPMFHVSGLFAGIILGLANGMRMILREGRFDEVDVLRIIERERVTSWAPVGGLGIRVIEHPRFGEFDTSSLRFVSFGGGPTSPAMRARVQRAFPSVGIGMANGYGSSETVAPVTSNAGADYEAMPDSVGRTNPTCDVEVWDEHDRPVPNGVEGEVHARSAYNMLGYWRDPDATARTLKPGRWLATGDIGRFDGDMLLINSRARDMIIRAGENVYPIEIERRLDAHPSIVESAVVGVDHDVVGQEVKAIVVPVLGARLDPAELSAWVAEALAPYKVPTHWEIRDDPLPRNASGKVLKTVLSGEAAAPPEDHRH